MTNDVVQIVDEVFSNPWHGITVILLVVFAYLYVRERAENEKLKERLNEHKEKFYDQLFLFLSRVLKNQVDINRPDGMGALIELDSKIKLYASDDVVRAWADFWISLYSSKNDTINPLLFKSYGYLQIAMRKDLGSSKTYSALKWHEMLRSQINDLAQFIPVDESGYRTRAMQKENAQIAHQQMLKEAE